ncbi:MAG: hypothetical protein HY261_10700, partial [Chloroflexi bacterium]|nr:hypothetical protein [Chloroflexota bacterium]
MPPPAATEAEARTRIQAALNTFNLNDSSGLDRVVDFVDAGRTGVPALVEQLKSDQVVRRWAGAYALSNLAETQDIASLRPALADTNATVRTLAAGTLLRLGNEEGLAVLRQAAASEEPMSFSEPPRLLRDYAWSVLTALGKTALLPQEIGPNEISGKHGLAAPLPKPDDLTEIHVVKGQPEITLNIEITGPGATDALVAKWKKGIEDMWSGKIEAKPGFPVKVIANVKRISDDDPPDFDYHLIEVVKVKPGASHRSHVDKLPAKGESTGGEWGEDDSGAVAAHEAGHLLGIDDEYQDTPDGRSVPKPEFVKDNEGDPSIMVQTWSSRDGKPPHSKPRHSQIILNALGFGAKEIAALGPTATPTPTATNIPPTATTRPSTPPLGPTPTPDLKNVRWVFKSFDVTCRDQGSHVVAPSCLQRSSVSGDFLVTPGRISATIASRFAPYPVVTTAFSFDPPQVLSGGATASIPMKGGFSQSDGTSPILSLYGMLELASNCRSACVSLKPLDSKGQPLIAKVDATDNKNQITNIDYLVTVAAGIPETYDRRNPEIILSFHVYDDGNYVYGWAHYTYALFQGPGEPL